MTDVWIELEWYRRNKDVIDAWLLNHPAPDSWLSDIEYAYTEMPNPESVAGQFLLWLGA